MCVYVCAYVCMSELECVCVVVKIVNVCEPVRAPAGDHK